MPYERITYTVKPGDTLSEIAQFWGTTVEYLLKVNPEIEDPDLIYVGQEIFIGYI
jgi:LysM repeat protein